MDIAPFVEGNCEFIMIEASSSPLISVLLPVRNSERWISEALESLKSQTFTNFEVIIIDDNSTDRTLEIARTSGISNLRIFQGPGKGIGAALALGVQVSNAKFIARQDADDLSHPKRFEEQFAYMETHNNCVVLGTGAKVIDEEGQPAGEMCFPKTSGAIKVAMNLYCPFVHPSVMLRREAVLLAGNYRSGNSRIFSEDYDLWTRMILLGDAHNINKQLVSYRINSQSVTGNNARDVNRSGSSIAIRTTELSIGKMMSEKNRRTFSFFYDRDRRISISESIFLYSILFRISILSNPVDSLKAIGIKRWILPIVWIFKPARNQTPLWEAGEKIVFVEIDA